MATKVNIIGGLFQDCEGNPLVNGYLLLRLSQDGTVNDSQICAGVQIKITLDGSGSIVSGQNVWGNDQLLPVNSYYIVTGYNANGQLSWGPNNQQIVGSGGTFDVGTWIPNSVISWIPPVQSVNLEVNGVPISSQMLLDFVDSASVSFTNPSGGVVTATAGGSSEFEVNGTPLTSQTVVNFQNSGSVAFSNPSAGIVTATALVAAGTSVFPIADVAWGNPASTFDAWPWTVATRIPGTSLTSFPSTWKISIEMLDNGGENLGAIQNCCVKRTLRDSTSVVDSTPITWGGTASPTLGIGVSKSDAITLALDANHDYYFMWYSPFVSGNDMLYQPFNTYLAEGGRYGPTDSIDYTGDTVLNAGLTAPIFGSVIKTWEAA